MPACLASSYSATATFPDWVSSATEPTGICSRGVRLTPWSATKMPKVLGPSTRRPACRAVPIMSCSAVSAAPPSSPNPAAVTSAAPTPAAAHSAITAGTAAAGLAITARSAWPSMAARLGTVVTPGSPRSSVTGVTPYSRPA